MPAPTMFGGLGARNGGLNQMGLDGPQQPQSFPFTAMPPLPGPYIAHLFTNTMQFKKTLGNAASIGSPTTKPGLKMTLNGGYHPITLELSSIDASIALGNVVKLTEQGDSSGAILFTGLVEEIPDEIAAGSTSKHTINLTPLVAELADAYFNKQYSALTDVAQMVRDAVAKTAHLSVQPYSCGDTGVLGVYNFNNANALEVLNVAKRIAGVNFWWFVDATGLVWFQAANASNPPVIKLRRGSDFTSRLRTKSIVNLKNHAVALGGYVAGAQLPITSVYDNPSSQASFGVRNFDPPLVFPTVNDQATLDKIVATIGAIFDRQATTLKLTLPAYASRLTLGHPGGLTAQVWEPDHDEFPQPGGSSGAGTVATYVVQDIEVQDKQQILITSDVPIAGYQDIQYEVDRIVQRATFAGIAQSTFIGSP